MPIDNNINAQWRAHSGSGGAPTVINIQITDIDPAISLIHGAIHFGFTLYHASVKRKEKDDLAEKDEFSAQGYTLQFEGVLRFYYDKKTDDWVFDGGESTRVSSPDESLNESIPESNLYGGRLPDVGKPLQPELFNVLEHYFFRHLFMYRGDGLGLPAIQDPELIKEQGEKRRQQRQQWRGD